MKTFALFQTFCWLLLLTFTWGCKAPHVYHANDSVIPGPSNNFYTAFIEFDDQGELWAPSQIKNAVEAIKTNNPVFLVTFIHGWKNNSEPGNENYMHFTNMLHALSAKLPIGNNAKVFGVYMSWRGDPIALNDPVSWTARQLSFWSRTTAAERVAGTSATEALYSVLQAANANTNSKVVLIGHSLGALVLEKAMSQAMVSTLLSKPGNTMKAPADLVLLVNSAAPSIYARQLITMMGRLAPESSESSTEASSTSFSSDRPFVISATSEGDWATGKVFPIGMWFSGLTKSFRDYGTNENFGGKQSTYYTSTPGHNKHLWSHGIVRLDTVKRPDEKATMEAERDALGQNLATREDPMEFEVNKRQYRIKRIKDSQNTTPYWVMLVPDTIIKDHDDIFNQRFTGFLGALLRLSQVTETAAPRPKLNGASFKQMAE